MLEVFKEQLDWKKLSANNYLNLTHELIEKYIDLWDWEKLINRADDSLYSIDFIFRYEQYISINSLLNSQLWSTLVETELSGWLLQKSESATFPVEPYALKLFQKRWYLLARSINDNSLRHLTQKRFSPPSLELC